MQRKWRKPSFDTGHLSGKEYGNAMHAVMQYICFDKCSDEAGIRRELVRLAECGFLTPEQADAVNPQKLLTFFASPIGRKLTGGVPYLREFKFSILDHGSGYDPGLQGEQILLQGVVDCALLEPEGITVIDFKTDYVTEATLTEVMERYRMQILTYADALQRIYQQPVRARFLYLFHLDRFVAI